MTSIPAAFHRTAAAAAITLGFMAGAQAQGQPSVTPPGMGIYLQLGQAPNGKGDTDAVTLGVTGPLFAERDVLGLRVHGYWDGFISRWDAPFVSGGDRSYTQIGLVPTARWVFDQGRSPFFLDAALGITYLDGDYRTPEHTFGSRWNFTERLGLGYAFGERRQHELSISLQHFSNAGIKKPNPGENFWAVRYAVKF